MSAYQPLYDAPAGSATFLAQRERSFGMSAFWPEALGEGGIAEYRLSKDGKVIATLDGAKRDWSKVIERPHGRYSIQARDAAGRWTPPLVDVWRETAEEMNRRAWNPSASGVLSGPRSGFP